MASVTRHPLIEQHFTRPPEWRMNPVTGEWIIIAPERAARPILSDSGPSLPAEDDAACPFCEHHEYLTPGELFALRSPGTAADGPGWSVRVVPNAFAAVRREGRADRHGDGFFERANGIGRHELFIECPRHETNLTRLDVEQVRRVVRVWRERLRDASRDPNLKYAQLFKNHGFDAGASVAHAHSQLIATPMLPVTVCDELEFARRFHEEHSACIYCELLRREDAAGSRSIFETKGFAVVSAYAARQPFETWIVPKEHCSQFEMIADSDADELGAVLLSTLRRIDLALDGPSYNLVFHSAPFHAEPLDSYHWHVEVLPRLTQLAGYEWGTGSHVNPILPEDAAAVVRQTNILP
jgi:UDPglucose--hexose-1-phosphate uridylyltransferase